MPKMNIKPLKVDVEDYLKKHQLIKKFEKAKALFKKDTQLICFVWLEKLIKS